MSLVYIAGYDGTDGSRAAIELTVALGRAEGASVVVAHVHGVVPPTYVDVGIGMGPEVYDELRAQGERLLADLDVDGVSERLLLSGTPAQSLHALAEDRQASLLAVGLTTREGLDRFIAGSVAAGLLHGSPCPVLTVPPGARTEVPRVIAVAYDGRPESAHALESAARLASALDAELVLLAVFESPAAAASALGGGLDFEADLQGAFQSVVSEAAQGVSGVKVTARLLSGGAAQEIVEATREGVDLLVTGSRGYGPLRRVIAGSVSRHLVDHAVCPVLVIPRSAAAEVDREPSSADE